MPISRLVDAKVYKAHVTLVTALILWPKIEIGSYSRHFGLKKRHQ